MGSTSPNRIQWNYKKYKSQLGIVFLAPSSVTTMEQPGWILHRFHYSICNTPVCQTPPHTASIYLLHCKNKLIPVNFQEYTTDHISMSNYNRRNSKCQVRTVLQFSYLNLSTNLNSLNGWSWNGSLEIILSKSPTQAEPSRAVFQGHVHMAFKHLRGRKFHNLSGWPVTMLSQPCS